MSVCGSSESAPLSSATVQECRPSSWSCELWTATIPAELKEPLRNFPGTQRSTVGSSSVPSPPLGRLRCGYTSPEVAPVLCPSTDRGRCRFQTHSSCLAAELRKRTIISSRSCQGKCQARWRVRLSGGCVAPRVLLASKTSVVTNTLQVAFSMVLSLKVFNNKPNKKYQIWMLFQVHFSPSDENVRLYKVLLLHLCLNSFQYPENDIGDCTFLRN